MIESSHFGTMTIDGRTYTSDLFIYPDGRVQDGWRRRQGHLMTVDDIMPLVDAAPAMIIVGTGTGGRMRPAASVAPFLDERGITWTAAPTDQATQRYNREISRGMMKVGACFHLTC